MSETKYKSTDANGSWFCKEDLEHHAKVIGTTGGDVDTSPVGMVKRGIYPISYLDQFPEYSSHYKSIQTYKSTLD